MIKSTNGKPTEEHDDRPIVVVPVGHEVNLGNCSVKKTQKHGECIEDNCCPSFIYFSLCSLVFAQAMTVLLSVACL